MFFTRMALDVSRAETQAALLSPLTLAKAVVEAARSPGCKPVWCVEQLGHRTYLLMVSLYRPSMLALHERFGIVGAFPSWETGDYDSLLEHACDGTQWHFTLCACVACVDDAEVAGNAADAAMPVSRSSAVNPLHWLQAAEEASGFHVRKDNVRVTSDKWHCALRNEALHTPQLYRQVWFEGKLTVTHQASFCRTLTEGLGLARDLGMCMMMISPDDAAQ